MKLVSGLAPPGLGKSGRPGSLRIGSDLASTCCRMMTMRTLVKLAALCGMAAALAPKSAPTAEASRRALAKGALATLAAPFVQFAAAPANAVVYLDPARYGDQELKNAAIAKCRTRVRDAIVKDPSIAPSFFLLARAPRPRERIRAAARGEGDARTS